MRWRVVSFGLIFLSFLNFLFPFLVLVISCHRTNVPAKLVILKSHQLITFSLLCAGVHVSSSIRPHSSSYGIGTPLNASRAFVSRVADHILEESFELVDVVR